MKKELGFFSVEEILKNAEIEKAELKRNPIWGNWKLNKKNKTLDYLLGNHEYEIDLETLYSSAEVLDWIFQILDKTWATPETIWNLCKALDYIFDIQGVFCSGGYEQNPKKKFLKVILSDWCK